MPEVVTGIESTDPDMQLNLHDIIKHAGTAYADQAVVSDMGGEDLHRYTYGEMYERVQQASNALQDIGISAGDAVGLYGYGTHQNVELVYAISGIGATPLLINLNLPNNDKRFCIEHVASHAQLNTFFVNQSVVEDLEAVIGEMDRSIELYLTGDRDQLPPDADPRAGHYEELIRPHNTTFEWPTIDENTAALMGFTSGTTGRPKALAHSHRAMWIHHIGWSGGLGYTPQDCAVMVAPLYHWGHGIWGAAAAGGSKLVLPGVGYPDNLADLILDEHSTINVIIPTLARRVVEMVNDRGETLEGKKFLFGAQAPPKGLLEDIWDLDADIIQAYGFSESAGGGYFCYHGHVWKYRQKVQDLPKDELLDHLLDTVGYPVPGVDIKLVDPETDEVAPKDGETPGELAMRAPWCASSYWKMPERTAQERHGPHLKMGDMVTMAEDNTISFLDRAKDAIKSGGEWIPTPTVESLINKHPEVDESAVFPVDHPEWMERPITVLTTVEPDIEGADQLEPELSEFLTKYVESGDIEKWWVPDAFIVIDEIPLTSTEKYDKMYLKEAYSDALTS
jgi:fatty-acyl-CoA synthase